jgi:signal transduction histidine kinase
VREGQRLSRLIENVLDFSRINRRVKQYQFEEQPLVPVVEEVLAASKPRLDSEGFTIGKDLEAVKFKFDRDAITQVLYNLIDNAIKFSDDNRSIAIAVKAVSNRAIITVADRGRGIAAPDRDKIFKPFYRAESEMTRATKGAGIGLALVKQFVEAHGGTITAAARDGGGTEFRIAIPG